MHREQQQFWVELLNVQRTWSRDATAMSFIPPAQREFVSKAHWPETKARAYLLNNVEFIRECYEQLEAGEPIDFETLNFGLAELRLRLHPWEDKSALRAAVQAKAAMGGRLEVLRVGTDLKACNAGTRYVRATVQRMFYYFAQYVDARLSDPRYPSASPGTILVKAKDGGSETLEVGIA